MTTLQPRTVAPRALRRWSRCALDLISRRWLMVLALNAVQFAVYAAIGMVAPFTIAIALNASYPGFTVMLFAIVAESIDQETPALERLKALPWKAWVGLYLTSALSIALMIGVSVAIVGLKNLLSIETTSSDAPTHIETSHFFVVHVTFVCLTYTILLCGRLSMMPSLLALGLRWFDSLPLSLNASEKNPYTSILSASAMVLIAMALISLIGFTGVGLLLAAVFGTLMPPFLGAMLYVAFRDIFLHQDENVESSAHQMNPEHPCPESI